MAHGPVFLVMCTRRKLETPAPARELYVSPVFVAARDAIEPLGARWFVLSGRHGLVDPAAVIEPYDVFLGNLTDEQRRVWAARVFRALRPRLTAADRVVFIAEPVYSEHLTGLLRGDGVTVDEPLAATSPEDYVSAIPRVVARATG